MAQVYKRKHQNNHLQIERDNHGIKGIEAKLYKLLLEVEIGDQNIIKEIRSAQYDGQKHADKIKCRHIASPR